MLLRLQGQRRKPAFQHGSDGPAQAAPYSILSAPPELSGSIHSLTVSPLRSMHSPSLSMESSLTANYIATCLADHSSSHVTEGNQPEAQFLKPGPTDRTQFLESHRRGSWQGLGPAFLGLGLSSACRGSKAHLGYLSPTEERRKKARPRGPWLNPQGHPVLCLRDKSCSGPPGFANGPSRGYLDVWAFLDVRD